MIENSVLRIKSDFPLLLTSKILPLYEYFSKNRNDYNCVLHTYKGFAEFVKIVNNKVYNNNMVFDESLEFKFRQKMTDSNKIVIGYSSGFDSTYQALKFKSLGYEVILLHCSNMNKSYPDEKQKALDFAKEYSMKLIIVEIEHLSSEFFIDNPIKNQLILSIMIDYGLFDNINNFALGNNIYENISECKPQYGVSDSFESFMEFRKAINNYITNINFYDIDIKKSECYKFVADNYFESFKYVNSCISPYRFKKYLNRINTCKYNIIPLSDERCLSCYKCAMEYLILSKLGFLDINHDFEKHCYNIIRNKSDTIFTTKIANKTSTDNDIERSIFNV